MKLKCNSLSEKNEELQSQLITVQRKLEQAEEDKTKVS